MTALIDAEVALARPGKVVHVDETRVVVSVGLPDGGVFNFVDRFMKKSTLRRVGDRAIRSLVIVTGLESKEKSAEMISNFPLEFLPLTKLYTRPTLKTLVYPNSCVVTSIKSNPPLTEWSCEVGHRVHKEDSCCAS